MKWSNVRYKWPPACRIQPNNCTSSQTCLHGVVGRFNIGSVETIEQQQPIIADTSVLRMNGHQYPVN